MEVLPSRCIENVWSVPVLRLVLSSSKWRHCRRSEPRLHDPLLMWVSILQVLSNTIFQGQRSKVHERVRRHIHMHGDQGYPHRRGYPHSKSFKFHFKRVIGEKPSSPMDLIMPIICRWQLLTQMRNSFWLRWKAEVFNHLQQRNRWYQPHSNLDMGDIVLIKDENSPPSQWPLARHQGPSGA